MSDRRPRLLVTARVGALLLIGASAGCVVEIPGPDDGSPGAVTLLSPVDHSAWRVDGVVPVSARVDGEAETIAWSTDLAGPLGESEVVDHVATVGLTLPTGAQTLVAEIDGARASVEIVVDTPPVVNGVSFTAPATVAADLVATADVTDADDDTVRLAWSWTVDGVDAGLADAVVPRARLRRGQVWTATVTPGDPWFFGAPLTAVTTIGDAVPSPLQIGLTPAAPLTGDSVRCGVAWRDADGDPIVDASIAWTVDGVAAGSDPSPDVRLERGDVVACHARGSDGAVTGEATVAAIVGDAPPEVASVAVVPSIPSPGSPVACLVGERSDPEDDPITLRFAWTIDGAPAGTGPTTTAPTSIGARLACTVVPTDGTAGGAPLTAEATVGVAPVAGNVIVILLDDIGVDRIGTYDVGMPPPPTPNIDALAASGVRFDQAWSQPSCSPSRAALLTGRLGARTGFGNPSERGSAWALPDAEQTIPEVLRDAAAVPYATAAIGKWHIGTIAPGLQQQPVDQGFDTYRGVPGNLRPSLALDNQPSSYVDYEYVDSVANTVERRTTYLTTVEADDAIAAVTTLPEPWFVYLAFHAVHAPYEMPPAELWSGVLVPGLKRTQQNADAATEALDHEIGRVLAALPPDTTVLLVGDNGTPWAINDHGPYNDIGAKQTVYEGGVRVPLIVTGPGVAVGARSDALVSIADVFATVVELGGVDLAALPPGVGTDSQSLLPYLVDPSRPSARVASYAEQFEPDGYGPFTKDERAVRDLRYKLVRHTDDVEELYDLGGAWIEDVDLIGRGVLTPTDLAARDRLARWLDGFAFR